MTRMCFRLAVVAIVAGGVACSDPTPPPPPVPVAAPPPAPTTPVSTEATQAMALQGQFPPGPELNMFMGKCAICHATSYIAQQRLTPAQWEKTIKKMKGWGAPVTDDEVTALTAYFSTHFPVDLAPPALAVVSPPPGATSEATP
jgi:cytochrome c5